MDTNTCRLCLVSKNKIIEFFSDQGVELNITSILDQHFWFQIHPDDNLPMGICRICWKHVKNFHDYYKSIETIHKDHYKIQYKANLSISNIKIEIPDSNDSLSFPNSTIDLVEPIVEIKIENDNILSVKPIQSRPSNTDVVKPMVEIKMDHFKTVFGKTKQSIGLKEVDNTSTLLKANESKNDNLPIKNADNQQRKAPIKIIKEQEQFTEENSIIVNNNISDENEIREELINLSTDGIENNDVPSNQNVVSNLENPITAAEDLLIREFFNFKCDFCSAQHSTMLELKNHYRNVHNFRRGYVLCCNKKLFKRCKLLEHISWHTNPNEFKCNVCNKIYGDKYSLQNHMNFHSKPEYICDICQVSFTLRYQLIKHFGKVHLTQIKQKFKCKQCDKIFTKKSALRVHIRGVHELKNVTTCKICAKVYKSKSKCQLHYLEEHVNVNQPKLKCNLCDVLLKNEANLKSHMRRKHLDKPEKCNLCGKITLNKNSLQNHIRNVHAERTHKCNLCDKAFKTPKGLREHTATHTGKCILYSCAYCATTFNSLSNMHSHRKKVHPDEWLEDRQKRLGITTK